MHIACKEWYNSNKVNSGEVNKFYSAAIRYFYSIHWEGKKEYFLTLQAKSATDIQRFWNFENGDYIFDPSDGEIMVWFGYPPREPIEVVWLPKQDQYQEICIDFYIRNMGMSRNEAFFHFLGWYAGCLKESYDIGYIIGENGEYKEIDSCEELMLRYTMKLIYWKRWNGEMWVKYINS